MPEDGKVAILHQHVVQGATTTANISTTCKTAANMKDFVDDLCDCIDDLEEVNIHVESFRTQY